jgi:hypothetical protein
MEMESAARKLGLQINQEKTKYMIVGRKNTLTHCGPVSFPLYLSQIINSK